MRVNRFFVNKPLGEETLTEDVRLVHQIKNVLRLQVSDTVIFFNGIDPCDYVYTVTEFDKKKVHFRLLDKRQATLPSAKIVLYLSLIKKELFELASLKATELGVTHIVPLVSSRTVRPFLDTSRLEKIITEGAEQSGRNTLPLLLPTITLPQIVSSLENLQINKSDTFALSLFGDEVSRFIKTRDATTDLAFIVGPEGGWTDEEEAFFSTCAFNTLSVSPHTLRAETAAIICTYLSSVIRN